MVRRGRLYWLTLPVKLSVTLVDTWKRPEALRDGGEDSPTDPPLEIQLDGSASLTTGRFTTTTLVH